MRPANKFRARFGTVSAFILLALPFSVRADYEVTSVADSDPSLSGELRYGVENASGTIYFSPAVFAPGTPTTISLLSALEVGAGLVIDGYYSGQGAGDVVLSASGDACLRLSGDGSSVGGLTLAGGMVGIEISGSGNQVGFPGSPNQVVGNTLSGIRVLGGISNLIRGNYIGLTASGASWGNGGDGVFIQGGTATVVGGGAAERNCISSNSGYGVRIEPGASLDGAIVSGNFIGTDPAGTEARPNAAGGIYVSAAAGVSVGGSRALGEGNLISGHPGAGVEFNACTGLGNSCSGNLIGTDFSGQTVVPNGTGIVLSDSAGVVLGGSADLRNLVGGNSSSGILLTQTDELELRTRDNRVESNYIGTAADGLSPLPNGSGETGSAGLVLEKGSGENFIGGPGQGNLISGNRGAGAIVSASSGNTFAENTVGAAADGSALGNLFCGIRVADGASGNYLSGNTLAFNGQTGEGDGVRIEGAASAGNLLSRNSVGFNEGLGIRLLDGANRGLDAPAISEVTWFSSSVARVTGTRTLGCGVELYEADTAGPGPGQGRTYLAAAAPAAYAVWTIAEAGGLSEGVWLTAVQFSLQSDTSEFSLNREFAQETPTPPPTPTPSASPTATSSSTPTAVPTASPPPTPTPPQPVLLYFFPLDDDPGWSAESDWAFGIPLGQGGGPDPINDGYPDPVSGYTGKNAYGYNLAGNYPDNLPETYYLTTEPIDCAGATQVRLVYRRWLNVECLQHDKADVQYSTDGIAWHRMAQNLNCPINTTDSDWNLVTHAAAGASYQPAVRFRWGMGPTDSLRAFSGWNLDDIEIWGIPQNTRTPTPSPSPSPSPSISPTPTPPTPVPTPSPLATRTPVIPVRAYFFPLDYNPSWTAGSGWEFGQPRGLGNSSGWFNPDPVSGATGINVYGYNLKGDYSPGLSATSWLTTPVLNCSFLSSISLRFRRWLNVERSQYDHALLEYSTNGVRWVKLWENPPAFDFDTADSSWQAAQFSLPAALDAAPALRFRWGLGPTDNFNNYSGWNIDDIEIWGIPTGPLPGPTPSGIPGSPTPILTPTPTAVASPTPSPFATPVIGIWLNPVLSGDYAGDGTARAALYRPALGLWLIRDLSRFYFGRSTDMPVSGDYNGDGTAEAAVFRSSNSLWVARGATRFYFGDAFDRKIAGDYDGDGSSDAAVFRSASGLWLVRGVTRFYYGKSTDLPVPGDYAGDGTWGAAVYRPSAGLWLVRGLTRVYYGISTDNPIPGRYLGGPTLPAVYRASVGLWMARGATKVYFGSYADLPMRAPYLGGGRDRIAIYRGATGLWALRGLTRFFYGQVQDLPATR